MKKIQLYFGCCATTMVIFLVVHNCYNYNFGRIEVKWLRAFLRFNTTEKRSLSLNATERHLLPISTTISPTNTSATTTISSFTTTSPTTTTATTTSPQQPSSKINITYSWIDKHPIYKRFYIKNVPSKKRVTVLVLVSSAPKRVDRRNAIRNTWWKQCNGTGDVVPECIFITDFQGPNDAFFHQIQTEVKEHDDIHMQLVEGGVSFGKRFIYHMLFAEIGYEYDYFVRIDDDQMFCLHKFLTELPMPPAKMFHWGWVHNYKAIQRPEECIILLSKDLIEMFLLQPANKMLCHPLADQMIAAWLSELKITKVLRHDKRIHHSGVPAHSDKRFVNKTDLCTTYISIHGVYSSKMKDWWRRRGSPSNTTSDLREMSQVIPIDVPFNWQVFGGMWRYEPKRCISNPTWDTSKLMPKSKASFAGRQEGVGK